MRRGERGGKPAIVWGMFLCVPRVLCGNKDSEGNGKGGNHSAGPESCQFLDLVDDHQVGSMIQPAQSKPLQEIKEILQ